MHGKEHGDAVREPGQRLEELPQHGGVIHVRRPMQRHHRVGTPAHVEARGRVDRQRLRQGPTQRVDHHVADEVHAVGGDALRLEVLGRVPGRQEQQIRQPVRDHPVDFLGHGPVAAAETGLDMTDAHLELCGHERGGDGGVHVAVRQDEVGTDFDDHRLEALHHGRRLLSVGPRPHAEVVVGRRDPQLLEKGVRHVRIVVLAGVDDHMLDPALHELAVDGGELHEVRAGADDGEDAHHLNGSVA